jgi:hypothetical protein
MGMLRKTCVAMFCCVAFGGAKAGELRFNYAAEGGGEYASGLRYDHDNQMATPPLRTKDFRYTFDLSAGATYITENFRFRSSYSFNQRTYDDFDLFHRRRHEAIGEIIATMIEGLELGVRYRYRVSQPEGALGYIESDQLRIRAQLPWTRYEPWRVRILPSAYSLWQTNDFHKLRFLDSDSWEAGAGFAIAPDSGAWGANVSVAVGLIDARFNLVSNSFVDVSVDLNSGNTRFFEESWVGPVALELDLSYREEWYEGLGSDLGTQRRDRISGTELTFRRQINENWSTYTRASIDDHESNWTHEDFNEVVAGFGIRFER